MENGRRRSIDDYRGLFWQHPWLAGIFTAMLLSLAGIPLTAGFVGKFTVVAAGVGSSLWLLVVILVLTSTIGLYYYLRVVVAMYMRPPEGESAFVAPAFMPLGGVLVVGAMALLLVWFGTYPAPLIQLDPGRGAPVIPAVRVES